MKDISIDAEAVRHGAYEILSTDIDMLTRLSHEVDKKNLRMMSETLSPLGISQSQALFIIYLSYYPDRITYQNVLEKTFGLTNPTVTVSIRSLVNKGIIERKQDPDDGRYYRLSLTEKGKTLYAPCVKAFLEANEFLSGKLTKEEAEQFAYLCKKILK